MIEESWLVRFVQVAKDYGATVAFDIGANVGDWTEMLCESFDTVVAVEPDPRAFNALKARFDGRNVVCIHAAVTSASGPVSLYLRPHAVQSSLLADHPIGAGDQSDAPVVDVVQVRGMTMDDVVAESGASGVLFVKVDVEGAEGDVLAGSTAQCLRDSAWLIEVHDRIKQVGSGLRDLGYDGIAVIPHPSDLAHPRHGWVYTHRGYSG